MKPTIDPDEVRRALAWWDAQRRLGQHQWVTVEAAREWLRMQEQGALDCGDINCRFATTRGGMRTNGGCSCFERAGFGPSAVQAAYQMLPEIMRLRAAMQEQPAPDVQAQCRFENGRDECLTHAGGLFVGFRHGTRPICTHGIDSDMQAQIDAAVSTWKEQLDAREKSSRHLAYYASHDEGFDAPMSGNDLVTRDALRVLRQAMEIAIAERAKAQKALIYLAREAGGSPVATIELDRHGQEIRAALVKLHEHAERIARLTGFVSMRLGAEGAGFDCVDTAIRFMESTLDEKEAAVAKERDDQSVYAAAFRLLRDEADAADAWHAETGMKVARPPRMSHATVKHIRDAEIRARSAKGV